VLPAGYRSDSGLSARNVSRRAGVARQHFSHNNIGDCPDLAVSAAYSAVTLSSVEDEGLGEELRVLLARTRCAGITLPTPGGMTRLDPSGDERSGRGVLVG
jgi:hypothetical protein